MSLSHLIIGLGNPGADYAQTRHNIGFMALDAIAASTRCGGWKTKFKGELTTAPDGSFLLLKPQTFMNLSGESAGEALRFHKLTPAQVIVFHDDLDLAFGAVRVKQGGGSGGHNGLKSLDAHIGQDYWRVRLGIGRPNDTGGGKDEAVTNYVLGAFAKAEQPLLDDLLHAIVKEFPTLLAGQRTEFAARIGAVVKNHICS